MDLLKAKCPACGRMTYVRFDSYPYRRELGQVFTATEALQDNRGYPA